MTKTLSMKARLLTIVVALGLATVSSGAVGKDAQARYAEDSQCGGETVHRAGSGYC
jgi:hypothetical protein